MSATLLQANLNRCRAAQDLLTQVMAERGLALAVAAEPHSVPPIPAWLGDSRGDVAIVSGYGAAAGFSPLSLIERGAGFVAAAWQETAVVGCYITPNCSLADFEHFLDGVGHCIQRCRPRPVLVLGDFNSWSVVWGSRRTNARGRVLEDWAAGHDLCLLNRGSVPTCVRWQGESIVDLSWASPSVARRVTGWQVETQTETLSDHRYVSVKVSVPGPIGDNRRSWGARGDPPPPRRWNSRSLDGDALMAAALAVTWPRDGSVTRGAEEGARWLRGAMSLVCDVAMRRAKRPPPRRAVYWWSREIEDMRHECVLARRRYTRSRRGRSPDAARVAALYAVYREAHVALQRAIRDAKSNAWKELLATIDGDPWGRPYRLVLGKLRPWAPPITESMDPRLLGDVVGTLFPRDVGREGPRYPGDDSADPITWSADMGVTSQELRVAVAKIRAGKAPGPDGVPGRMWASTLDVFGPSLLEVINKCLEEGVFPSQWKSARLVLLRKEGRPADTPSAYRPICLLDEAGKILERIIANRLVRHLSGDGPDLSDRQYGFRAGRSTIDAIARVRSRTNEAVAAGGVALAVSLDIVNAFNSLPWARIREALAYHRVPPYLRRIVGAYLSDRQIEYVGRCRNTERRVMDRGVPQGSVLGPLLWDIAYDAVLRAWMPPGVDVVCYADDTLVIAGGPHWRRTSRAAELAVARVVAEIRGLGLEVAPRKTQAMWFCGRGGRTPPSGTGIMVGGVRVEMGTELNYLGLVLDPQWRFGTHFNRLAPRLEASAGSLSRLLPNLRGPKGRVRRLYAGVVRSMALYGAPIWADNLMAGSRALLGRLHRRMAIRVVCGYRTISGGSASALAALPPWELEAARQARLYRNLLPLRQGEGGVPTQTVAALMRQARQSLVEDWQRWLSEPPRASSRAVAAILPCLPAWEETGKDVTYRMCQVLTGHGCFGVYLEKIRKEATTQCHHCGAGRDCAQHTLEVCPSWESERADLVGVIGRDLSLPAVVRAMMSSERSWKAMVSFCERVMLQKEAAERERIRRGAPGRIGDGGPTVRGRPGRRARQP